MRTGRSVTSIQSYSNQIIRTTYYCYYNLHDLFQPCILCVAEDSFIKLGTFHMNTLINFSTTGKEVPIKLATVVQLIISRMFNKLGT